MINLENEHLAVSFCEKSGAIRALNSKRLDRTLIKNGLSEAFILERSQNDFSSSFDNFTAQPDTPKNCADFYWKCGNASVHAGVMLEGVSLVFSCRVENNGDGVISSIEYPLLDGIREFGDGSHCVCHSFATGIEIDDPLFNFDKEDGGFRYMPYPESFSGSSMQFFGYGVKCGTGLFFAANDSEGHQKWLNFYKHGDALRASQIAGYEDITPCSGINIPWEFSVTLIDESNWESFADEYKAWAREQAWADEAQKRSARNWLNEYIGAATFGINASHDRTKWLKRYREDIGHPIFHVLGPDWPRVEQNFHNSVPGGLPDWFPARFSKENIECIRAQGDKFAPFEFDFLAAIDKSEKEEIAVSLQKWPDKPKSVDKYTFNMLCPAAEYTRKLHIERDAALAEESGCDAFYYDISANNIIKICMSAEHGHKTGGSAELTRAYKQIYRETREAAEKKTGKPLLLGTEMMNETLIGELDYYQARANAQPCSALETWPFRALIRQGKARVIPLFAYVYGSVAPVRLDGWGKLVKEGGDLIYHTIAKTYLWGGLFEINHEYSEPERLGGESTDAGEHYYRFKPEGYEYDKNIAGFIRKCAALRLGLHGEALRHGEMTRRIHIKCRKIYRTYHQYNHGTGAFEQHDRGIIALDAVMVQGYIYNDACTIYVINTSLFNEEVSVILPEEMNDRRITIVRESGETVSESEGMLSFLLTPLEIVVINQKNYRRKK